MALYFALLGLAILGTRTMLGGGIFCKARVDAQRVQPAEK